MKKLLVLLVLPLFMGAGCNSKVVDEPKETKPDIIVETDQIQDTSDSMPVDNTSQEYTLYENKAIGYTVMRPDGWYWQHFMKSDLEAAGSNELIDDYLIIDKNGLMGLRSEYLGQIVVEKSRISLEDFAKDKDGYSSREVTVAGQTATRFEKQTNEDDLLFPNKRLIEYHLTKDGSTYRLMYMAEPNPEYEAIFEKVVASFSFVK